MVAVERYDLPVVGPGADNSQYNFFCKKKDETNYGAPRSLSGAISLEAGIYNLIAVRGGVTITTNPVDIKS